MPNPVVHFEVTGKDGKKLQDFYREAFDWRLDPAGPDYMMVHTGADEKIAGGEVPDLAAALKKIEALGGRTITPSFDVPGGPTIAVFVDPEDHVIGLVKARPV